MSIVTPASPPRVRTARRLVLERAGGRVLPILEHAEGRYAQVWLTRAWLRSSGVDLHAQLVEANANGWNVEPRALEADAPGWAHCYRRGHGVTPAVDLAIPDNDVKLPGLHGLLGVELLDTIRLLDLAVGVGYARSPEHTAAELLRVLHTGPGRVPLEAVELPECAELPNVERDPYWLRELTAAERRRSHVVAYDANAAYLAAAGALTVGGGELMRAGPPWGPTLREVPGYFHAAITFTPEPTLPSPFEHCGPWVTTPTLQLLDDVGGVASVRECWHWSRSTRPLDNWARVLRDARANLRALLPDPAAARALTLLKLMYGPFLGGRIASTAWNRRGDPLYRPDWRHLIIATARARQYRTLLRLAPGCRPFAIASDCLYFATDSPQEPPAELRVSDRPGHYKRSGTALLAGVVEAMNDAGSSPRSRLRALAECL